MRKIPSSMLLFLGGTVFFGLVLLSHLIALPANADSAGRSDFNGDGRVDLIDYSLLFNNFLKKNFLTVTDLNGDNSVNFIDYSIFAYDFTHSSIIAPSPTVSPSPTSNTDRIDKKVLFVGVDPVENGQSFANRYFSTQLKAPVEQAEDRVFTETAASFQRLSAGKIRFTLAKKIRLTDSPQYPDGFRFTLQSYGKCVWGSEGFDPQYCETRKNQFDYVRWVQDVKLCEIADEAGADEIWMMSNPYILRWEAFMIGPDQGFDVNGANYTVPGCTKHIIVMNATYDRPDLLFHNIGHRVEATMEYLTSLWTTPERALHWRNFARMGDPTGQAPYKLCGNTHFPFNTNTGYDVANQTNAANSCADWANFPNYTGNTQQQNCNAWGCTDSGWQEFWLGSIPYSAGYADVRNYAGRTIQFPKNWWPLLLSPDEAIKFRKTME